VVPTLDAETDAAVAEENSKSSLSILSKIKKIINIKPRQAGFDI
jgi:hypothetical protein